MTSLAELNGELRYSNCWQLDDCRPLFLTETEVAEWWEANRLLGLGSSWGISPSTYLWKIRELLRGFGVAILNSPSQKVAIHSGNQRIEIAFNTVGYTVNLFGESTETSFVLLFAGDLYNEITLPLGDAVSLDEIISIGRKGKVDPPSCGTKAA